MIVKQLGSNQTELEIKGARVLFSYSTPVACQLNNGYYRTSKKWSVTTSRHINEWLNGNKATEAVQGFFDDVLNGRLIFVAERLAPGRFANVHTPTKLTVPLVTTLLESLPPSWTV